MCRFFSNFLMALLYVFYIIYRYGQYGKNMKIYCSFVYISCGWNRSICIRMVVRSRNENTFFFDREKKAYIYIVDEKVFEIKVFL